MGFVMPLASLSTWAERRQSAMMQDRLGPNRANIGPVKLWGILHFVADAIKMMFKEDVVPSKVDRFLFALAPVMAIAPVLITFAVIPFGPDLCAVSYTHLDVYKRQSLPLACPLPRKSLRGEFQAFPLDPSCRPT